MSTPNNFGVDLSKDHITSSASSGLPQLLTTSSRKVKVIEVKSSDTSQLSAREPPMVSKSS